MLLPFHINLEGPFLIALVTDVEMLGLGVAVTALTDIASATRDLHREAASDYIRGQLAPRYSGILDPTLDDTNVSFELKNAVAVVASYHLLSHRGYNPTKGSEKQIQDRFDKILLWLKEIKTYKAELVEGALLDRGAPVVGGSATSRWENWRNFCRTEGG